MLRALLDDPEADLKPAERDSLLGALVSALRDGDDHDAFAAAVQRRLESLEARIAAEPGPNAFTLRSVRASLLIQDAGRPADGSPSWMRCWRCVRTRPAGSRRGPGRCSTSGAPTRR